MMNGGGGRKQEARRVYATFMLYIEDKKLLRGAPADLRSFSVTSKVLRHFAPNRSTTEPNKGTTMGIH